MYPIFKKLYYGKISNTFKSRSTVNSHVSIAINSWPNLFPFYCPQLLCQHDFGTNFKHPGFFICKYFYVFIPWWIPAVLSRLLLAHRGVCESEDREGQPSTAQHPPSPAAPLVGEAVPNAVRRAPWGARACSLLLSLFQPHPVTPPFWLGMPERLSDWPVVPKAAKDKHRLMCRAPDTGVSVKGLPFLSSLSLF